MLIKTEIFPKGKGHDRIKHTLPDFSKIYFIVGMVR